MAGAGLGGPPTAQAGSSLVIRDTQPGTYTTRLSNGATVTSRIGAVPAALDLTSAAWHLDAEDWQPANPYGAPGPDGTLTTKVPVSVDLSGLRAWPDIPQLASASGIGALGRGLVGPVVVTPYAQAVVWKDPARH
jgi:hypothetical protein